MKKQYKLEMFTIENYKDFDRIIVLTVKKANCLDRSCRIRSGKGMILDKVKLFFLSLSEKIKKVFRQIASFLFHRKEQNNYRLPELPFIMIGQLEKY